MKPNDEHGRLPPEKRPFRVLILAGSDRRQYNCPGVDSKARTLMLRMAEKLPHEWEISLWRYVKFGDGKKYSDTQAEDIASEPPVYTEFDDWTNTFTAFVETKGKVTRGKFRAFGYNAPGHRWRDLKLKWRELKMQAGRAPSGSSPAIQEKSGLNRDAGIGVKKSEGEKLRDE